MILFYSGRNFGPALLEAEAFMPNIMSSFIHILDDRRDLDRVKRVGEAKQQGRLWATKTGENTRPDCKG